MFLISAAGGALAFIAINWNEQGVAVGASGAVCGVFSAYFLSARRTWREALSDPRVRGPFGMILLLNVVLMGVVSELGWFPIAWEGHLGGFVAGALAYVALAREALTMDRRRPAGLRHCLKAGALPSALQDTAQAGGTPAVDINSSSAQSVRRQPSGP